MPSSPTGRGDGADPRPASHGGGHARPWSEAPAKEPTTAIKVAAQSSASAVSLFSLRWLAAPASASATPALTQNVWPRSSEAPACR